MNSKSPATIISLNVGLPSVVAYDGIQTMYSGIVKKPVTGSVFLDTLGFEGDGSADRVNHGGMDKAVCVYCHDHYPFWEKALSKTLVPGAFGENLSVAGLAEDEVHVGDVYLIGAAKVQCSQPRQPCHKLNKFYGLPDMAARVQNSGYTGFYVRVLEPGRVQPASPMKLVQKGEMEFSISAANQLMYGDEQWNFDKIRRFMAVQALSTSWKEAFSRRLEHRAIESTRNRLQGS